MLRPANTPQIQKAVFPLGRVETNTNWHRLNGQAVPLKRVPRVNDLGPLVETTTCGRKDSIDEAVDHYAFHAKTVLAVFLLTMILIIGILVAWNLKNALGIDLFPGVHHDFIDQANAAFGI